MVRRLISDRGFSEGILLMKPGAPSLWNGRGASLDGETARPTPRNLLASALASGVVLLTLAGCASNRAIPEFALYLSTYEAAAATVDTVLNEFEGVERERSLNLARNDGITPIRLHKLIRDRADGTLTRASLEAELAASRERIEANNGFDDRFHPIDSVYYATNQPPPVTAAFRRSFAAIGAYNDVLEVYAEGRALDDLKNEAVGLAGSINRLAEVVGAGSTVLQLTLPGGPLIGTGLEIVTAMGQAGSREAFRREIVRLQPAIDETLVTMREASPRMFRLFTSRLRDRVKDADTPAEEDLEAIEKYRVVMSNWVVALNSTQAALQRVVDAISAPTTPGSLLADLTATTESAAAVAEPTRRLLGEIRNRL